MHLNHNLPKKILAWYDNNKRTLPWRVSKNSPKNLYYRLLSEFMLQQTQVNTVIPYFNRFIKNYSNLKKVSKAPSNQILKLWEGLGYYRRAKALHKTIKIIVRKNKSKLPNRFEDLKKLPGIGDYTANVLLALVYNQQSFGVDGNVKRLFSRILNKPENKIDFDKLIYLNKKKIFFSRRNSDLAESLMEFGSQICKPKIPECKICPIKKYCNSSHNRPGIKKRKNKSFFEKKYDIFCYLNKNSKKIGLTKNDKLGFLKHNNMPIIKERGKENTINWIFLANYNNHISNKKLNINLYYKFSKRIPKILKWHPLKKNKEFIPSFTKKIFKKVSSLYL